MYPGLLNPVIVLIGVVAWAALVSAATSSSTVLSIVTGLTSWQLSGRSYCVKIWRYTCQSVLFQSHCLTADAGAGLRSSIVWIGMWSLSNYQFLFGEQ